MRSLLIIICFAFVFISAELLAIDIELGTPETEFQIEVTYKADSSGLLYLQHNSVCNQLYLEVYIGDTPETLKKVGEVRWFGTITFPIESGKYWEVRYNKSNYKEFVEDLQIRWTTIIGCACD